MSLQTRLDAVGKAAPDAARLGIELDEAANANGGPSITAAASKASAPPSHRTLMSSIRAPETPAVLRDRQILVGRDHPGETAMGKRRIAGSVAALLLVVVAGRLAAQPRADGGAATMGPGMMGQGMMGQGMMGPGMMQPPSAAGTPPAAGSSVTGADVFRSQCAACHTLKAGGASAIAPNLYGLFGRRAGRRRGYAYSAAMRHSGVVWSGKTLDAFLANPAAFIPGNKMPFPGIRDQRQRQALITYLRSAAR